MRYSADGLAQWTASQRQRTFCLVRSPHAWNRLPGLAFVTFDWTVRIGTIMKAVLLALAAFSAFSLAACEEKSPLEKAADKAEDVIDKAN